MEEETGATPSSIFEDKIVVDAMNPYSENFEVIDLGNSTPNEEVRKQLSSAPLVKLSIRCITKYFVQEVAIPRIGISYHSWLEMIRMQRMLYQNLGR